jgi:UDP-glucose 4-epimerase
MGMKNAKVLITGGAGFIGTQIVHKLREAGANVAVVDRNITDWNMPCTLILSDYLEYFKTIQDGMYNTVIHLAAEHLVEQSVYSPGRYYENNVVKMKTMLDLAPKLGINNFIFSSSGNIYGRQGALGPLTEDMFYDPENPYASSKVAGELLLKDYSKAYKLKHVTFRYFNAAGADPNYRNGYTQEPATHVIPALCRRTHRREVFNIFGTDYLTRDGTCVRDYVHIDDIAQAHVNAVDYLLNQGESVTLNIGGGSNGVSVKELITHTEEITDTKLIVYHRSRRTGDPTQLIANISKAKSVLGWEPKYNVKDCIRHAWEWNKIMERRRDV